MATVHVMPGDLGELEGATIRLREWRERRGYTQEQLAAECARQGVHVSANTISRIERGLDAYVGTLARLARVLRVKAGDLVEWEDQ